MTIDKFYVFAVYMLGYSRKNLFILLRVEQNWHRQKCIQVNNGC